MPRFYEGPPWRFAVTDLTGATVTFLDRLATDRAVVYRLNGPSEAVGTVPADNPEINLEHTDGDPFLAEGTRLLYGFRRDGVDPAPPWRCRWAGTLLQVYDELDGDRATSRYTAFDPWQLLFKRPVRTGAGAIPGEDGLSFTDTNWDVVIGTLLKNTIGADGTVHVDAGTSYGGTAEFAGTIESVDDGGIDVNFPRGTSVGDAWMQVCELGGVDIVLTPIYDPANRPGYTHELNVYALAGDDKPEAIFREADSLRRLTRLEDGTKRANRIHAFHGPDREPTAGSPHVDTASQTKYGRYVDMLFHPEQNVGGAVDALAAWQLLLRKTGQTLITFAPIPERAPRPLEDYTLGDRVPVWATRRFRKPINGDPGRIYGISLDIGDDALETVNEILLTATGT